MMDNGAFEEYVRRYADTVYRVAFNHMRNSADAEDVAQNVMIRFYKNKDKLCGGEHIKAWLIRVAMNEARRSLHRNSRHAAVSLGDYANMLYTADIESRELFLEVMSLDEKYRDVLYLYYYERYTAEEIARLLGTKPSTVRTRLSRARAMMKTRLEDYDE